MAANSSIEWTHLPGFKPATWNPIAGCTPISPGCTHCYAATMARRLEAMGQAKYAGTAERRGKVDVFTGRINFDEDSLGIPLRAKKPTCYFVNSMSDLFHESVPFTFVDQVFRIMGLCQWHVFQVLTKRAERMAEYLSARAWRNLGRSGIGDNDAYFAVVPDGKRESDGTLPNVWLGVSVEDQQRANERILHLLNTPAAVRFLSCEPLLGPLDLSHMANSAGEQYGIRDGVIDWVIVGGESGPHSRPCDVAWIRSIVEDCKAAGVPVFVKQVGAYPVEVDERFGTTGIIPGRKVSAVMIADRKGGDPSEWPEDLRVRQYPEPAHA